MYHAVVQYLTPIKVSVAVYAVDKEDAEALLQEQYEGKPGFKLIHLDNATPDIERQLTEVIEN